MVISVYCMFLSLQWGTKKLSVAWLFINKMMIRVFTLSIIRVKCLSSLDVPGDDHYWTEINLGGILRREAQVNSVI